MKPVRGCTVMRVPLPTIQSGDAETAIGFDTSRTQKMICPFPVPCPTTAPDGANRISRKPPRCGTFWLRVNVGLVESGVSKLMAMLLGRVSFCSPEIVRGAGMMR